MSVKKELDEAYRKKVVELVEDVTRKTAIDIDKELVLKTPVDTGRARSNWLPSINAPRTETVSAGTSNNTQSTVSGYKLNDTIFISNNLPYIERLNNGWSKQNVTPSWVEATVQKYSANLKRTIAEVKRGL